MGWRNGLADEPSVFVTCIGDGCGVGTASLVTLAKCPVLSLCHVQQLGSAMAWQSGQSGNTVMSLPGGADYLVQDTSLTGVGRIMVYYGACPYRRIWTVESQGPDGMYTP